MPKVEPIKVLTVDEVPMNVAELSETVQQLVGVFDDWNVKEEEARSNLMMVGAAKDTLSRQIIQQIRADKAAAEAKAKATEQPPVAMAENTEAPVATEEVVVVSTDDDVPEDAVVVTGDESE